MYHQPIELDVDHDSSDPLNPTVNYTHFHPSPEQQDPRVPLGFKIYGIGCLAAFLMFLLLAIVYVIFHKQIRRFRKSRRETQEQQKLGNIGKPSLPKSLEIGDEVNEVPSKSYFYGDDTALSPPPICTSSSYEGESARYRGKPREAGSWDSSITIVDVESPHLGPSSLPPMGNGEIRSNYSPVSTSNAYAPTPHAIPMRSLIPHLDRPISPKTIPATSHYISPIEPAKAVTTDGAHRTTQAAAYQTSPPKSNNLVREERSDISQNERRHLPFTASGRTSVSSRKGILKTSPTYVARNSSQSLPHLSSDGALASTHAREGLNDVSRSSVSANPLRGSMTSQPTSSDEASISPYSGERRESEERKAAAQGFHSRLNHEFYASMRSGPPVSPTSIQESLIVNLGPDPKLICQGSSGTLARRVTISIPSSSTRSHRTSATSISEEEMEALQREDHRSHCRGSYRVSPFTDKV